MYFVRNILYRNFDNNMKCVAGQICGLSEKEQNMIIASVDEEDDSSISSSSSKYQ